MCMEAEQQMNEFVVRYGAVYLLSSFALIAAVALVTMVKDIVARFRHGRTNTETEER